MAVLIQKKNALSEVVNVLFMDKNDILVVTNVLWFC